jgi:hypothetical protein
MVIVEVQYPILGSHLLPSGKEKSTYPIRCHYKKIINKADNNNRKNLKHTASTMNDNVPKLSSPMELEREPAPEPAPTPESAPSPAPPAPQPPSISLRGTNSIMYPAMEPAMAPATQEEEEEEKESEPSIEYAGPPAMEPEPMMEPAGPPAMEPMMEPAGPPGIAPNHQDNFLASPTLKKLRRRSDERSSTSSVSGPSWKDIRQYMMDQIGASPEPEAHDFDEFYDVEGEADSDIAYMNDEEIVFEEETDDALKQETEHETSARSAPQDDCNKDECDAKESVQTNQPKLINKKEREMGVVKPQSDPSLSYADGDNVDQISSNRHDYDNEQEQQQQQSIRGEIYPHFKYAIPDSHMIPIYYRQMIVSSLGMIGIGSGGFGQGDRLGDIEIPPSSVVIAFVAVQILALVLGLRYGPRMAGNRKTQQRRQVRGRLGPYAVAGDIERPVNWRKID